MILDCRCHINNLNLVLCVRGRVRGSASFYSNMDFLCLFSFYLAIVIAQQTVNTANATTNTGCAAMLDCDSCLVDPNWCACCRAQRTLPGSYDYNSSYCLLATPDCVGCEPQYVCQMGACSSSGLTTCSKSSTASLSSNTSCVSRTNCVSCLAGDGCHYCAYAVPECEPCTPQYGCYTTNASCVLPELTSCPSALFDNAAVMRDASLLVMVAGLVYECL